MKCLQSEMCLEIRTLTPRNAEMFFTFFSAEIFPQISEHLSSFSASWRGTRNWKSGQPRVHLCTTRVRISSTDDAFVSLSFAPVFYPTMAASRCAQVSLSTRVSFQIEKRSFETKSPCFGNLACSKSFHSSSVDESKSRNSVVALAKKGFGSIIIPSEENISEDDDKLLKFGLEVEVTPLEKSRVRMSLHFRHESFPLFFLTSLYFEISGSLVCDSSS